MFISVKEDQTAGENELVLKKIFNLAIKLLSLQEELLN